MRFQEIGLSPKITLKVIEGGVTEAGTPVSGADILYETDDEGFDVAVPDSEDDEDRVKVRASRGGNVSSVTVNLDDSWAAE